MQKKFFFFAKSNNTEKSPEKYKKYFLKNGTTLQSFCCTKSVRCTYLLWIVNAYNLVCELYLYFILACIVGIQIRKSKIYLNMEALSIDCRNKHWSQCFNRILIWSSGSTSICPAVVVQAALDSRAACTTTAGHIEVEPVDEIKIGLKHCDQCLFLQPMLSGSKFKSFFVLFLISDLDNYCTF